MMIEKNGKTYAVTESTTKWTLKSSYGKLDIAFDVAKESCATFDELREYVLNDNDIF